MPSVVSRFILICLCLAALAALVVVTGKQVQHDNLEEVSVLSAQLVPDADGRLAVFTIELSNRSSTAKGIDHFDLTFRDSNGEDVFKWIGYPWVGPGSVRPSYQKIEIPASGELKLTHGIQVSPALAGNCASVSIEMMSSVRPIGLRGGCPQVVKRVFDLPLS